MSRRFFAFFIPVLILLTSFSKNPDEDGLKVTVNKLRNNSGHVLISLFKDGSGYPDEPEKAIRKARVIIKNNEAWVIFTGLPSGSYAIAILHDENDDMTMNKNALGIPKEGYGFSNNVMGTFGPPSFSRASLKFITNTFSQLTIRTRY